MVKSNTYRALHWRRTLGVCLGAQAIAEYYGGRLTRLMAPAHGEQSVVTRQPDSRLLQRLPAAFKVGRYHSLAIVEESLPPELQVTARAQDGTVMAVEDARRLFFGVQFHPESVMTAENHHGRLILETMLEVTNYREAGAKVA